MIRRKLFHRTIVLIVKQNAGLGILNVRRDVVERHRPRRRIGAARRALPQQRRELRLREIPLAIPRRVNVGDVLRDQALPRRRELQHALNERRIGLIHQAIDKHDCGLHIK